MHEGRIRGLRRRLDVLEEKALTGRYPIALLQLDLARTKAELAFLTGIRARNQSLADEAAEIAARAELAAEAERVARELAQLGPGLSPAEQAEHEAREAAHEAAATETSIQDAAITAAAGRRRRLRERLQQPKGATE